MSAQKSSNPILRFALKFILLLVLFGLFFGYFRTAFPHIITLFTSLTASMAKLLLKAVGLHPDQSANVLNLGGFSVQVVLECAGVYQLLVFSAAVIAFPADKKKKLWGILAAIPIFYVVDLVRIATLLTVGHFKPRLFDFVHLYTGQIFVIFIVILTWLLWIKKFAHAGKTA
ncbi:MAG: exosortase H [candidate division Zixibacteria bacterium RBG_16_48_11]|nr:MAG: exosortase H [candidate division Zixibacteria bacterium RBG_16_48_11]